ncbi:inactive pancreatic lipase-related protein 1-like isoform X2 [Eleutherodactylus coqui]|uniref:inactive pancreatic lipase-related protein 1-like isoform X2 n=1 Tax=Eleutherodactylus coqui TaxID=57060 RepID=UPI003463786B
MCTFHNVMHCLMCPGAHLSSAVTPSAQYLSPLRTPVVVIISRRSVRMWMEMFLVLLQPLFLVISVEDIGETKCYKDLGCFTNKSPYRSPTRPISEFPQSPEEINTQFLLFTKANMDDYQILSARDLSTFKQSHFDCRKETVFIIHGYLEKGDDPWLKTVCKNILMKEDMNCVCVDWRRGASSIYTRAINNVQVVGAEIAFFINTTMKEYNCSLTKIHMIGHSLGAHAAGEAGKRRPGIEKMTILDAAGPGFSNETDEVVVNPSVARFVVALHTDAGTLGLGTERLIGHKDFFLNGGKHMTGCDGSQIMNVTESLGLVGVARDFALCSHVNSYYVFIESIQKPEGLMGYCASDYSAFQKGDGFPCTNGSCSLMGYYTLPQNASSCRVYYLNTGPRYDFGLAVCLLEACTRHSLTAPALRLLSRLHLSMKQLFSSHFISQPFWQIR